MNMNTNRTNERTLLKCIMISGQAKTQKCWIYFYYFSENHLNICMTYGWLCCDINNLVSRIDDNDKEGMETENVLRVVYVSVPRWISADPRKTRNTNELEEVEYKKNPQNSHWFYFFPNFCIDLICLSFKTNIRTGCLVFLRFHFFRKRYCFCCGRPRYHQSSGRSIWIWW